MGLDLPPQPDPAPRSLAPHPPRHATVALLVGAAASVGGVVQFVLGTHEPLVVLAINLGLVVGAFGLLLLIDPWLQEAGDVGILQFVGFLAIALLGRVWLGQTAQGFAILLEYSPSLGALAVASACALFRGFCARLAPRRSAFTTSLIGGTAFLVLVVGLLATSPTRQSSNLALLGLTCIIVTCLFVIQCLVAVRLTWEPGKIWATALAIALAGTQLFDGVLTYLVVEDPLGIAPAGFEEQIPVSRLILDWFGIGFPIAKWALGLVVALMLAQARFRLATYRTALYLAILAAGLGPGLYSAAQLF